MICKDCKTRNFMCETCMDIWRLTNNEINYEYDPRSVGDSTGLRFGVELELTGIIHPGLAKLICKEVAQVHGDSSVDGIEIVSDIINFEWYKNNKEKMESMPNMGQFGYSSRSAGMHVHVTKPGNQVIYDILTFFFTYPEFIFKFSKRSRRAFNQWAYMKPLSWLEQRGMSAISWVDKGNACSVRSQTLEFRLFRSTTNAKQFHANIQFSTALVQAGGKITTPEELLRFAETTDGYNELVEVLSAM